MAFSDWCYILKHQTQLAEHRSLNLRSFNQRTSSCGMSPSIWRRRTFFQVAPPPIPLAYRLNLFTVTVACFKKHVDCRPPIHCQSTLLRQETSGLTAVASCHRTCHRKPRECPSNDEVHPRIAYVADRTFHSANKAVSPFVGLCMPSTTCQHTARGGSTFPRHRLAYK